MTKASHNNYSALSFTRNKMDVVVDGVMKCVQSLYKKDPKRITLIGQGTSSLSVLMAIKLHPFFNEQVDLVMARKPGEQHHGNRMETLSESKIVSDRYVFLDDFICSGDTREDVKKTAGVSDEVIEEILYADCGGSFFHDIYSHGFYTTVEFARDNRMRVDYHEIVDSVPVVFKW
jgi:hypothetical protein